MLTYGSEAWTVCKQDRKRITAAEMEFMSRTPGYTHLDYERYLDIMKESNTPSTLEFTENYRHNWENCVLRISLSRIPPSVLRYHPQRGRSLGRSFRL
jgi:hypothetical protein